MKYKNVSNQTLRIAENTFLQPGKEIELSDDEVNAPEMKGMIKNWNWLEPIATTVITNVIQGEINKVGDKPMSTADPLIILPKSKKTTKPTIVEQAGVDAATIQAAIDRSTMQKLEKKSWNPMDDAVTEGEPDYVGPPIRHIDTAIQYGNAEVTMDPTIHPIVHLGGSENDDPDVNPTGRPAYIPHHPEDLVPLISTPMPEIMDTPKVQTLKPVAAKKKTPAKKAAPKKKTK